MNFRYEDDLPRLPDHIVAEIYRLVENPIGSYNDADSVYTEKEKEIIARPDLQLNSVNKDLLDLFKNKPHDHADSLGFPIETCNTHFTNLAKFDFLSVTDLINNWICANISPRPALVTIQVIHGGPIIIPHVDEGRSYVYNYILDTADAVTKFYKNSKGNEHLVAYPRTVFTYDRIEEIETIDIQKDRWHYLDVSKIHNVENVQPNQKRISLSLSYV
jgi:hypothetical protein